MEAGKSRGLVGKTEEWHGWGSHTESRCWLQWQRTNRAIAQGDHEEEEYGDYGQSWSHDRLCAARKAAPHLPYKCPAVAVVSLVPNMYVCLYI